MSPYKGKKAMAYIEAELYKVVSNIAKREHRTIQAELEILLREGIEAHQKWLGK